MRQFLVTAVFCVDAENAETAEDEVFAFVCQHDQGLCLVEVQAPEEVLDEVSSGVDND